MSLLKRFGRRLAAISAVAATACGVAPAAEPVAAKPALWKVADKDTTIYLFGTVHLLPKGTQWRSPAFDKAVAASDALVVETIVDEKNPEPVRDALRALAVTPGLPPLVDRVSPEKRAALIDVVRISGIPIEAYNNMETWAGGYLLLITQLGRLGLDPGVESTIKTQFADAGKPVGQLETVTEQFSFFDSLPEPAQRKFVEEVLEDPAEMKKELDGMVGAWSSGDVKAISRTFNDELKGSQDLKTNLLVRRNSNWAKWVKGRLDQPGTVLVAVGAGHLAGDQSVQTMLESQGVKVTRVQ